jgi:hypothetical protein
MVFTLHLTASQNYATTQGTSCPPRVASVSHGFDSDGCNPLEFFGFVLRSVATRRSEDKAS